MSAKRLGSLVAGTLSAVLGCASAPPPLPTPACEPADGLASRFPRGDFAASGDHVVGLLFENLSPWGSLYPRDAKEPQSLGHDGYSFCRDGRTPQALYFPSSGEGINFMRSWSVPLPEGGQTDPVGVAMLGPGVKNRHGLSAGAHLVRLEVNGGRGAPATLHFIATGVEVLDGTADFPIVPARSLADARRRFDRFAQEQRGAVASLLAAARKAQAASGAAAGPAGEAPPFGPEVESVEEGAFPTWSQQSSQLSVLFVRKVVRTRSRTRVVRIAPPCPPGAPCMLAHDEPREERLQSGVQLGYSVTFDRNGAAVEERCYGPARIP